MANKNIILKSKKLANTLWFSGECYKDGCDKEIGKVYNIQGISNTNSISPKSNPVNSSLQNSSMDGDLFMSVYRTSEFETTGKFKPYLSVNNVSTVFNLAESPSFAIFVFTRSSRNPKVQLVLPCIKATASEIDAYIGTSVGESSDNCYIPQFDNPLYYENPSRASDQDSDVFSKVSESWKPFIIGESNVTIFDISNSDDIWDVAVYASAESYNGSYIEDDIGGYCIKDLTSGDHIYWDGAGWKRAVVDGITPSDIKDVISDVAATSVVTGAFTINVDWNDLARKTGIATTQSNSSTAQGFPIRLAKIPNFSKNIAYLVLNPDGLDADTISNIASGHIAYPGGNYVVAAWAGSSNRRKIEIKISSDGEVIAKLYAANLAGFPFENNISIVFYPVNILNTFNLNDYLSSCSVSSITKTGINTSDSDTLFIFNSSGYDTNNIGTAYSAPFMFKFTPAVDGDYTVQLCLYRSPSQDSSSKSVSIYTYTGTSSSTIASDFSVYGDIPLSTEGFTYVTKNFTGCTKGSDYYIEAYCAVGTKLATVEVDGIVSLNSTDEGAQVPLPSRFISESKLVWSSNAISSSTGALGNNVEYLPSYRLSYYATTSTALGSDTPDDEVLFFTTSVNTGNNSSHPSWLSTTYDPSTTFSFMPRYSGIYTIQLCIIRAEGNDSATDDSIYYYPISASTSVTNQSIYQKYSRTLPIRGNMESSNYVYVSNSVYCNPGSSVYFHIYTPTQSEVVSFEINGAIKCNVPGTDISNVEFISNVWAESSAGSTGKYSLSDERSTQLVNRK